MHVRLLTLAAAAAIVATSANATSYTSDPFNGIAQGGSYSQPTTTNAYGQYFNSPGGTLSSLTFVDTDATATGTQLVVQAFNSATLTAIGPVLYQGFGTVAGYGDGSNDDGSDFLYYHNFSNIGALLAPGLSYVAYLADAPGTDTFNGVPTYDIDEDTGEPYVVDSTTYFYGLGRYASDLGGSFVYRNPGAATGQTFVQTIDPTPGHDRYFQADYTLNITPLAAAVPEPASWAMMLGGFGLMGTAMRRRRTSITFA